MKILFVNGSSRHRKGTTFRLIEMLKTGMEREDAQVNIIDVVSEHLNPCIACYHCWKTGEGCIHNDRMSEILEEMLGSDLIIFATPLYINNISALMKQFMERTMPLCSRGFRQGREGIYQHVPKHKIPPIMLLCSCALPEKSHLDVVSLYYDKMAASWDTEVVGKILCTEASLYDADYKQVKILLKDYENRMKEAGAEIARNGYLSEKTEKNLNRILIRKDFYIQTAINSFLC